MVVELTSYSSCSSKLYCIFFLLKRITLTCVAENLSLQLSNFEWDVICGLLSVGLMMAAFVCRKSVSKRGRPSSTWGSSIPFSCMVLWCKIRYRVFHFFPPRPSVARFILEPKSVLFNEQEQKLNDSESAIASMQVCLIADPVLPDCVETEISIDFSLFVCYFLVRHPKTTLRNSRAKWRTILGSCFNRTQDLRVRSSQWPFNESCFSLHLIF